MSAHPSAPVHGDESGGSYVYDGQGHFIATDNPHHAAHSSQVGLVGTADQQYGEYVAGGGQEGLHSYDYGYSRPGAAIPSAGVGHVQAGMLSPANFQYDAFPPSHLQMYQQQQAAMQAFNTIPMHHAAAAMPHATGSPFQHHPQTMFIPTHNAQHAGRRDMQRLQSSFGAMGVQQMAGGGKERAAADIHAGERNKRGSGLQGAPSSLPAKPNFSSPILDGPQVHGDASPERFTAAPQRSGDIRQSSTIVSAPAKSAPTVPLHARLPTLAPLPDLESMQKEQLIELLKQREEQTWLRVEAIGFQPELAWKMWNELQGQASIEADAGREVAAPILGIRLLQRLDVLQRENEELGELIRQKVGGGSNDKDAEDEIRDAHVLIDKLDMALSASQDDVDTLQKKVVALEQALAVACSQNSSATSAEQQQASQVAVTRGSTERGRGHPRGGAGGAGAGRGSVWSRRG